MKYKYRVRATPSGDFYPEYRRWTPWWRPTEWMRFSVSGRVAPIFFTDYASAERSCASHKRLHTTPDAITYLDL